mmetsp:Transcript_1017/g.2146  ORF Transcript_1017/g.2146 Transcript_1017/m.2146 type:complete len:243 (-) Transcript_1017:193-921(-)
MAEKNARPPTVPMELLRLRSIIFNAVLSVIIFLSPVAPSSSILLLLRSRNIIAELGFCKRVKKVRHPVAVIFLLEPRLSMLNDVLLTNMSPSEVIPSLSILFWLRSRSFNVELGLCKHVKNVCTPVATMEFLERDNLRNVLFFVNASAKMFSPSSLTLLPPRSRSLNLHVGLRSKFPNATHPFSPIPFEVRRSFTRLRWSISEAMIFPFPSFVIPRQMLSISTCSKENVFTFDRVDARKDQL